MIPWKLICDHRFHFLYWIWSATNPRSEIVTTNTACVCVCVCVCVGH